MQVARECFSSVASQRGDARLSETKLLEMVASGCTLPDVVDALCSYAEDLADDCRCAIYTIDGCGALPADSVSAPRVRMTRVKTEVISLDAECCWSTPIHSRAGGVLATFAVFQRAWSVPTQSQQELISQVTHIASIAIERAQNESALKRSEAFLAEAQRLSSTGSFSWRVATDEITWSDEMYRIFQYEPRSPVTLQRVLSRVHPDDLLLVRRAIARARRHGSDYEYEYRLAMPDLSIKHVHVVARATRSTGGGIEFIGAIQDITERRRSQIALDAARSELACMARLTTLGALTASIAHELNQPLAGIVTNASTCVRMLSSDPPNVQGALETARRSIRDGNRASDVITGLRLLFARKAASTELVDLNDATREVIALSLGDLQKGRVILQTELTEGLPSVLGNRVQLQQVILNLVMNASEAMSGITDHPRRLLIQTGRSVDNCVWLTVQDSGIGIRCDQLDKLFEAFYTTKGDGMGIGLSISRFIIDSHCGRLWASPNEGPGASFSFSIPHRMRLDEIACRSRPPMAASSPAYL
jgi:signal transduction histidine kinase